MGKQYTEGTPVPKPADRPKKPFKGFPLTIHPLGYYSKKVQGKVHFFGRWGRIRNGQMVLLHYEENWQAALKDFRARYDSGSNTVVDEAAKESALTLKLLCNKYLQSKLNKANAGHLTQQYVRDITATAQRLCDILNKNSLVESLGPDQFEQVWGVLSKRYSPVRLGVEITRIKGLFKYAEVNICLLDPTFEIARVEANTAGGTIEVTLHPSDRLLELAATVRTL